MYCALRYGTRCSTLLPANWHARTRCRPDREGNIVSRYASYAITCSTSDTISNTTVSSSLARVAARPKLFAAYVRIHSAKTAAASRTANRRKSSSEVNRPLSLPPPPRPPARRAVSTHHHHYCTSPAPARARALGLPCRLTSLHVLSCLLLLISRFFHLPHPHDRAPRLVR